MTTYYPKYYFQDSVGMATSDVKPVLHSRLIDFATRNITTADAANMLPIPQYSAVLMANYQTVTTVTSASSTFVIASNTAAITYVSSAAAVAAGSFGVPAAISANTAQKWYATKDDLQINTVAVANLTIGQLRVFAILLYPQPISYVDVDGNTKTYTFTDRNNWQSTAPTIP